MADEEAKQAKTLLVEGGMLEGKHKVTVGALPNMETLKGELKTKLVLTKAIDLLEVWDEEFKDWIVPTTIFEIGDKAKLRVSWTEKAKKEATPKAEEKAKTARENTENIIEKEAEEELTRKKKEAEEKAKTAEEELTRKMEAEEKATQKAEELAKKNEEALPEGLATIIIQLRDQVADLHQGQAPGQQRLEEKIEFNTRALQHSLTSHETMLRSLITGANKCPWRFVIVPDPPTWLGPTDIFIDRMRLYFLCAFDHAPVDENAYYEITNKKMWVESNASLLKYGAMALELALLGATVALTGGFAAFLTKINISTTNKGKQNLRKFASTVTGAASSGAQAGISTWFSKVTKTVEQGREVDAKTDAEAEKEMKAMFASVKALIQGDHTKHQLVYRESSTGEWDWINEDNEVRWTNGEVCSTWSCSACTFRHEGDKAVLLQCLVCETPKPNTAEEEPLPPLPPTAVKAQVDEGGSLEKEKAKKLCEFFSRHQDMIVREAYQDAGAAGTTKAVEEWESVLAQLDQCGRLGRVDLTQGRVDQKAKAAKTVQQTRVLKMEGLRPERHPLSCRYALMGQYKEEYGPLGFKSLSVNERRVWKMTGEDYLYLFYAQRETEEDKRWHWWIGGKKSMEKGEGNGIARVASTAYTPNKITGVWWVTLPVTNQVTGNRWHAAPEMKVTVHTPAKQEDVHTGSAKGISSGGTLSEAAQVHLGKYEKRMQEETALAESAGKDEDEIIAQVELLLLEEMRRDSLTEETAEELIKRLGEDYQCESGSDEEDDEAEEAEGGDGEGEGGSDGGGDDRSHSVEMTMTPPAFCASDYST
jgi:hypothetical protein